MTTKVYDRKLQKLVAATATVTDLLTGKEDVSNKVGSWSSTPNNTRYPGEKLVKDSLDAISAAIPLQYPELVISRAVYNEDVVYATEANKVPDFVISRAGDLVYSRAK